MTRKRIASVLLVLALLLPSLVSTVEAQTCTGWSNQLQPYDFESIVVSTAAIGFTTSKISTATSTASYAFFTAETADGRYRVDGVADPTAAVGHIFVASTSGQGYFVCGTQAIKNFRAIRSGGSDSTLRVTYYKGA